MWELVGPNGEEEASSKFARTRHELSFPSRKLTSFDASFFAATTGKPKHRRSSLSRTFLHLV